MRLRHVGMFQIDADDQKQLDSLARYNTVAMMMPFIRSQIALLTSQPRMSPLVLPAIDIVKLIDEARPSMVD